MMTQEELQKQLQESCEKLQQKNNESILKVQTNFLNYLGAKKQLLETRIPEAVKRFQRTTIIMLILQSIFMFQGLAAAYIVVSRFSIQF